MAARKLLAKLIRKVVTEDGVGTAEVERCFEAGEISEEEKAIIMLRASTILVDDKLNEMKAKIEVL